MKPNFYLNPRYKQHTCKPAKTRTVIPSPAWAVACNGRDKRNTVHTQGQPKLQNHTIRKMHTLPLVSKQYTMAGILILDLYACYSRERKQSHRYVTASVLQRTTNHGTSSSLTVTKHLHPAPRLYMKGHAGSWLQHDCQLTVFGQGENENIS